MIYIIFLAVGLAMDAFCVSLSLNLCKSVTQISDKFKVAFTFALFQVMMPFIGYVAISPFISSHELLINVISSVLLIFLGLKMLKDSFNIEEESCEHDSCQNDKCNNDICKKTGKNRVLKNKDLLVFALATSIDALLAGPAIHNFDAPLHASLIVIFLITLFLSLLGLFIKVSNAKIEKYSEYLGALILIVMGILVFVN